jgi:dolichyl-diphosphooligosaccharide--protein glycosyltransferase
MSIFALILGITGLYVSATFARLLVFASMGVIVLAGLGLYEVTRGVMAYREATATPSVITPRPTAATREERRRIEFAGRGQSTLGQSIRISYVVVIIMMLSIPMFYPSNSNWLSSADIPPAIANGGTGFRTQTDDWTDAMSWIEQNTEPDAVIASWWDYGYWITTLGGRTTLSDNATINSTRIATIAKMLISDEQSGLKIAQDLQADYILVYTVGQIRAFGQTNVTGGAPEQVAFYTLGQGGDESKKQWFMRIGGFDETRYIERDGFTPTPEFWNNTLLGKLFPFEPLGYANIGAQGLANIQQRYQQGLVGIYAQNVKYPADGGSDQPLHLVYASPSFENEENILFGVFIYKVNHDYVPKPQGNPYAPQQEEEPAPQNTTGPEPAGTDMTASSEIAVIETAQGTIKMEFFPNAAPNHVENFIELANGGLYDGTLFHRIIPDFMIQGGDPNTKGDDSDRSTWGQGGPENNVNAEFNDIPHSRGIVSMARAQDPNSAGSQFFIVHKDSNFLDGQYTVFGRVIEGMDVVDKIAALETFEGGANNVQPVNAEEARIISIKIQDR